jgi:dienelactone hydrolase
MRADDHISTWLPALRPLAVAAFSILCVGICSGPALSQAVPDEFVVERTFLRTTIEKRSIRLEALIIKRSDVTEKLPVALITHGKSSHLSDMLGSKAVDYAGPARDLARRGWLAVVVMRRGFGQSDGPMAASVSCATTSFADRFAADADDLQGALAAVSNRPDADPGRAIAIGVSAGGAAVVALGAQSAFLDGGGDVRLVMYEKFGNDGHSLFTAAAGKLQWLMEMDAFLRFHALPAAGRDRVAELMKLLKLETRQRGFVDRYVAAPTYKVMVQTPDGKHHFTQFGAPSLEGARKAALAACAQKYKASEPCRVVMENDAWLGREADGRDQP